MIHFTRITSILVLAAGLAACASTDEPDYSKTGGLPPLEVPPDLTSVPADRSFDLPAAGKSRSADPIVSSQAPMVNVTGSVIPEFKQARIVRAGSQRWAVIQSSPEVLWQSIRNFLIKLEWDIKRSSPDTGIMDTDWKEVQPLVIEGGFFSNIWSTINSTGLKDRFRFRIERGRKSGEVELYVTHQLMEEVVVAGGATEVVETAWQPADANPEREAEMLMVLLRYLESGRIDKKKPGAKVINAPAHSKIGKNKNGYPVIQATDPLETTWRRLGIALDRAGFLVQDRNKSKNLYFVYLDNSNKKQKGFFSSMFDDDEDGQTKKYFQVKLAASGQSTFITMLDTNGNRLDTDLATKLLKQLDQELKY